MIRRIDAIIVHCADTPNGRAQTVTDIDAWHRERGFHRSPRFKMAFNPALTSIGYHYVIYLDGTIHTGRHMYEVGAHAVGHNSRSLGICLIGRDQFTPAQWGALRTLVSRLRIDIGTPVIVCGHRDLPQVRKSCPGFSVPAWLGRQMVAEEQHVLMV